MGTRSCLDLAFVATTHYKSRRQYIVRSVCIYGRLGKRIDVRVVSNQRAEYAHIAVGPDYRRMTNSVQYVQKKNGNKISVIWTTEGANGKKYSYLLHRVRKAGEGASVEIVKVNRLFL